MTTVVLTLACLLGVGACQQEQPQTTPGSSPTASMSAGTASGCSVQAGDVSVFQGGTFPVDPEATIRAGLERKMGSDPLTWRVMFLAGGGSSSHDLTSGDTVRVAGRTITVRDVCADRVVLLLDGGAVSRTTTGAS